MFQHRPVKPIGGDGGGNGGGKGGEKVDSEESWLSKQWGKISFVAMVTSISLLYNYFQGYRNRNAAEDKVVSEQAIEPLEVNEIRLCSKGLTNAVYSEITLAAFKQFPDGGQCSYREFVAFVRPRLERAGVSLSGVHLLDRLVEAYVASSSSSSSVHNNSDNNGGRVSGSGQQQKAAATALIETPLPLGYGLLPFLLFS
jgi:hypothetical protein